MEWQQIIGFHSLVTHRSFTRAADATFRTQSALSQQIKKLEDELQCRLIDRQSRRRFTLTAEGERFFKFASSVVENHQRMTEDIHEIKGQPRGRLRIAAPFTTLYHLFPGEIRTFLDSYPFVDITIYDRPQSKVAGLLKRGAIDIGVAIEARLAGDFAIWRWKEVETVLIVPQGHPLTRLRSVTLQDIARYPLILPPRTVDGEGRSAVEDKLAGDKVGLRVAMESGNVELSSMFVEQGLGVAFATVARGLKLLKGRKIKFISLNHIFKTDHLALAVRKERELPYYVESFIKQLLKL